jgi:hypothetical protein
MKTLFYPQEQALICDYLGLPRPESCRDIDLWNPPKRRRGIWPQRVEYHDDRDALSNAVARIALGAIQDRLPQWALVNAEGQVILGREDFDRSERLAELLPQFVLEINWASNGPGMDWPEAYYAAWLPGFDTTVITASVDSTSSYGYTDITIGSCKGRDMKSCALKVLEQWWSKSMGGWEECWNDGLVTVEEAFSLAEQLWPHEFDAPGGAVCGR